MSSKQRFVAAQFSRGQGRLSLQALGNGLINDTFLVDDGVEPFVLQRVNPVVFPNPEQILENLAALQAHLSQKTTENFGLRIPRLISTMSGNSFYRDDDDSVWRAQELISPAESRTTIRNDAEAAQVGSALGRFHRLCADLAPSALHDTLPGFHVTPAYLKQYRQLTERPISVDIDSEYRFCEDFIDTHSQFADLLENARNNGKLQERVTHGDPKLNNFLFEPGSNRIVSLIDLDTVKAGLVHYDIADCLRSCCHDKQNNRFDLKHCEIILQNYLDQAGNFFDERDYDYLYQAIWLIPFELGLRFFSDYLRGNLYFKINDPKQNLRRAYALFTLCNDIDRQQSALQQFIHSTRTLEI